MHKGFLITAVLLGAFSVILGAFAAHALKGKISNDAIAVFETGVRYQFYHCFALLATAMLFKEFPFETTLWAARFFIIGIILFSGSLYCLTWIKAAVIPGYNFIGAITPFGGLSFIAGWILLMISFLKK